MASLIGSPEAGKAGKPQTQHHQSNTSGSPSEWLRGGRSGDRRPCQLLQGPGREVTETQQGTMVDAKCELSSQPVWLFATPGTVAPQAPLSMGFSKQEYWRGLPFPFPGDLPKPGIKPVSPASPALAGAFFATEPPEKPHDGRCRDGYTQRLARCAGEGSRMKPPVWLEQLGTVTQKRVREAAQASQASNQLPNVA